MTDAPLARAIDLDEAELLALRLTLELYGDEHCPFGPIQPPPDPARIEVGTRSLVRRGLVERRGFSPDRDLTRRVLVVSEPDARVVLLATGPGQAERVMDVYERTGAYVEHARPGDRHRLGPVLEAREIFQSVRERFAPRRSTGDFIELGLDAPEHFALLAFAQELAVDAEAPAVLGDDAQLGPMESTLDGAVLVPGATPRLVGGEAGGIPPPPVPTEAEWRAALRSLEAKDILRPVQGGFQLKPYLRDLAVGLVQGARSVLTRFDFRAEGWVVRDATFVPVPGSLFVIKRRGQAGLRIQELEPRSLERALHEVVDPI
ncbi:MAG: hypothetical protein KC933_37825 [Myxococcales bacterium]|nr:hypothetical protein [Myxococcales bacterium]MCB9648056.1 hypothetical protein [Deltaproteobacteria bacterium]